jgi:hypothetical protein
MLLFKVIVQAHHEALRITLVTLNQPVGPRHHILHIGSDVVVEQPILKRVAVVASLLKQDNTSIRRRILLHSGQEGIKTCAIAMKSHSRHGTPSFA